MTEVKKINHINHNEALDLFFVNLETLICGVINLQDQNRGLTISIDAPFGFGKTHFIDLLLQRIKENNNQLSSNSFEKGDGKKIKVFSVRYNAWEDDYQKDPFIALAGQIYQNYTLGEAGKTAGQNSILKKLGEAICALDISLSFCGVGVGGNIREMQKAFSTPESNNERNLGQYLEIKRKIEDFKKALAEISDPATIKLIIVDELDRCNPLYSMRLLELIKHLFGAKNMVFLLTVHKKAMISHVKHCYGYDQKEGECYLSKFFDFELTLPLADNFADKVIDCCSDLKDDQKQVFIELAKSLKISTRDQLKLIEQIKFLNKVLAKNFRAELLMLMILKTASYEKFQRLKEIASTENSLVSLQKIVSELLGMFNCKKGQLSRSLQRVFVPLSLAFVTLKEAGDKGEIFNILTQSLGLEDSEKSEIINVFSATWDYWLTKKTLIQFFSLAESACHKS